MKHRNGLFVFILEICVVISYSSASQKRGIALTPSLFLCDDFKAMHNITWWYDWGLNFHTNCTNLDDYKHKQVPMVWGWDTRHTMAFTLPFSLDAQAILGFNEPNFYSQANLTAAQAVTHWSEIEKHSHGRPLVSPAASPCSTQGKCYGNAFEWFDEFFKLCHGCRIDFLATHAYWCDANYTMSYLHQLYNKYGKKIWLTEFACPNTNDRSKVLHFMQDILPRLEAADFVYRYSWYKARIVESGHITTAASLLHSHTSSLTSLGEFYFGYNHNTVVVG